MFFMMLVSFYTSRIVLNVLGVVDYGVYNVVGGIVGILSALTTSMAISTQRWLTIALGKGDEHFLRKTFSVGLATQGILSAILLILMESVGLWYLYQYAVIPEERMGAAFWVFQISVATSAITVLSVPFHGAILAHEKMDVYALFSIIDILSKLAICFILPAIHADKLTAYGLLLFAAFVVYTACMWTYCRRKFSEVRFQPLFDKAMMKSIGKLAFWNMTGKIVFASYSQGLILLINAFFGPAVNAASAISSQATNILNQFGHNIQISANPQITKNYASGNYQEMQKLVFRSIKFSYYLMLLIAVPLFYEAEILLRFWLGYVPEHAVLFTQLAVFWTLTASISNPLNTTAVANGNMRNYQLAVNSVMILILPVSFIIYKNGCIPESSSVVFIIFSFISSLVGAWILQKQKQIAFKRFIAEVILTIIKVSVPAFLLPIIVSVYMPECWERLVAITAFSAITTTASIYFIGLNKDERLFTQTFAANKLTGLRNKWKK